MTVRGGVGYQDLLDEAKSVIDSVTPEQLASELEGDDIVLIDLRDIRELEREGLIEGALHAPRGMLEFWIDPDSPYARPIFQQDKCFVFYCRSDWRSALAGAVSIRLGLQRVRHLEGGFSAWLASGRDAVPYEKKRKKKSNPVPPAPKV
jgi:rhodanese-related sulfurtransferase